MKKIKEREDVVYTTGDNPHAIYINKDGANVPSATTILKLLDKSALLPWANWMGLKGKRYDKHMEMVSYIGTCVHEIIECRLWKKEYKLEDPKIWFLDVKEYIASFDKWVKDIDINPITTEEHLVSNRFGGTCDCYCVLNGKKTILDFKTSKSVYMTMFLQLGAYIYLKEEKGDNVEQVGILTVNKDKCYVTLADRKDMDDYIQMFLHLVDLFYENYEMKEMYGWKK